MYLNTDDISAFLHKNIYVLFINFMKPFNKLKTAT